MPDTTPTSDHDDVSVVVPAPPQPVHYAEQALLGALLLEPHRLQELRDLEPEQFADAAHRALFTALRATPPPDAEEHARDATGLTTVLTTARATMPTLTPGYPHQLIQACPWPRHLPAYARIVQGEHARRLLRAHATQLARAATDRALPDPVPEVIAQAHALAALLDRMTGRFASHPGSMPRTPPPPPPSGEPPAEAVEEERMLLAGTTARPSELAELRWLMPADFLHPLHATLWTCLTTLAHRGADIDPVTLLWEAQHCGALHPGGTTAEDVLAIVSTPVGSPGFWAEKILRRSLLTRAQAVAARVISLADDPANTSHQLVVAGRRALIDLTAVTTRLHQAMPPAPVPRARAVARAAPARPRAGPPASRATR
ncbi:replicative DNA helicase [Streptomyces fradiae]|uniref:DnaB-like helicase N-terminal domain-containing protein n=1 Tax=Streptomyces fradiae TaxID=1906 RepID=UPI002019244F|nr:DnaB-like helicase N-terminal domain-containing protein [Streptomyces fradiae]UQS30283.1 replicative DNA helicase [Streptomyces fradiae]